MYDVVHFNGDRTTILFVDLLQKNKHFLIINWEQFDVLITHSQIKKIGQQIYEQEVILKSI